MVSRSCASLASARTIKASSDGGTGSSVVGRFSDGGVAALVSSARRPSRPVVGVNGSSPVSMRYSVTASENTSVRPSTGEPDAASGDM